MEEVKPIVIEDGEKTYTLRFTRETIKRAENSGFDINELKTKPMTRIPELWFWSFQAEGNVPRNKTDDILFNGLGGLNEEIVERLGNLYAEPFDTLFNGAEKNVEGKKVKVKL